MSSLKSLAGRLRDIVAEYYDADPETDYIVQDTLQLFSRWLSENRWHPPIVSDIADALEEELKNYNSVDG